MKISNLKFKIQLLTSLFLVMSIILFFPKSLLARERFFQVQSVDTMKYSRDLAREKIKDNGFDQVIEAQVKNIAGTDATHVSLGTPYEAEFLPFLKRWVETARKYNLNVWFRGNLAGWEKWFDYPRIDRQSHTSQIRNFILNNPELFADGDVFTSCPECENGGPGDPRQTGDVEGFRRFIIDEYEAVKESFAQIDKRVTANFYSMNGDVARLVMDRQTTEDLDGVVTIDHYVSTPQKLEKDIIDLAEKSGGKLVLGEFGAPIPDIHGNLSEREQADWIDQALARILKTEKVVAINYWTSNSSSTELWEDDNKPRLAVLTLAKYYSPINVFGTIKDSKGEPINEVSIKSKNKTLIVAGGSYILPVFEGESLIFSKLGYISVNTTVRANDEKDIRKDIILAKSYPSPIFTLFTRVVNFLKTLINK